MALAIALRSPYYISDTAGTGANSAKLTISINGTIEYTLVKLTTSQGTMLWEISELCRDFINIDNLVGLIGQTLAIITTQTSHASTDGSGTALTTDALTFVGYDGYTDFMQGANSTMTPSIPSWLISSNPNNTSSNDKYYIYVPVGVNGFLSYYDTSYALNRQTYNTTDIEIVGSGAGTKMNIVRIDCTKYGNGHKITFVNKYGVLQDLWFFLKSVNTTSKKQEQFQRNIVTSTGTYNTRNHTKQDYNTVANTSISLSSGYYPEWCNQWFEELLLSEQVWLERLNPTNLAQTQKVPVNVKKSNMIKKTSLNERLIDYTFEFDMSFDYINNVR